ncbi:MAG: hypothetical protein U5K72_18995 [Balneolaceae bacterium]|nr:hypothetical protein [Balneolaceae bacterium]
MDGTIAEDELGFTLTHEHIMSNFGKDISEASEYDEAALLNQVAPYLKKIKTLGVDTIFDCTTAYFGRRVDLLQSIADSTGLKIVTNTGFYGAAGDRYIPEIAYESSAEEISKIWVNEFENGIDGTNIKPGFIKLAFDGGASSEIDIKLFQAGILAHLQTGLTMAVHTGDNLEAFKTQLNLLEQYDVSPEAWIWTHASWGTDIETMIEAARERRVDFTTMTSKSSNILEFIDILQTFKSENLLHKVLLSHDGNGFPGGGEIRPFEAIMKNLIPAMQEHGFNEQEINQIFIQNPKKAFSINVRKTN